MRFQYEIKMYFTKSSWFCACWWSCNDHLMNFLSFYTRVFTLDSFILQWWAHTGADLNLGTYQAIHLFLVILWLFSASWEHFQHHWWHFVWLHGVIQVLQYCAKQDEKKYMRTARDHFLLGYAIYWKDNCSHKELVSCGIWSRYNTSSLQ